MWMADILPHTAKMADDICLLNSMWTDHPNHDNALYKIHSGRLFMGYPTLGAWTVYGLGSENQNLPAYVVLNDPLGLPKNGTRNWTSGFLPPVFQGTPFRPTGSPILNLKQQYEQPSPVTESARGLLHQLDQIHRHERPHYLELDARIESYGLAARMQLSAGEALDLSREDRDTLKLYGIGQRATDSFGRRCLLARRLVERGVRFVQIFLEEQPWDSHVDLAANHRAACQRTDKPVAALLRDLKRTGLLDTTLVIWGGEFGRTPTAQRSGDTYTGRVHNMQAFIERVSMETRNSRIGLVLFGIYLLLYGGFVFLNAFSPESMEAIPVAGVNLAIVFGFGLILAAFVLAVVYGFLCRTTEEQAAKKEADE